jgi:L-glutamine-phosphate cytidylyltransferase
VKGIILAAGRGRRMGNLTDDRPKCLVNLAGKTLLERQLASMREAGVDDIAVVTGYRPDLIAPFAPQTFFNPRWSESNMVVSLTCARPWLSTERCVISYSDIFYDASAVSALTASSGDLCMTYDKNWLRQWSQRFADPLSDAETFKIDAQGHVAEIGGRATSVDDIQGQYMGLLAFTPEGWSQIEKHLAARTPQEVDKLDMTKLLSGLITNGATVTGVPFEGFWGEVDNAGDLALFERLLAGG